ncbi:nuclear pore complex protein nup155 [Anaeramoeba flamelloides]|uniref:Nuclear pore complex protein nup155 n=1 Tax=Anaeramoeba flamelloides TaxID=1746091 RepID=A0ABQ8YHL0_9EUKA|nr:nuclear pore complex protein nup155 [Anaeramoeba flamelloides]
MDLKVFQLAKNEVEKILKQDYFDVSSIPLNCTQPQDKKKQQKIKILNTAYHPLNSIGYSETPIRLLFKKRTVPLPKPFIDELSNPNINYQMGLFTELEHCWIIIEKTLLLWDYVKGNFVIYDDLPSRIISIALTKPGAHYETEKEISHFLVLATTRNIYALGVVKEEKRKSLSLLELGLSLKKVENKIQKVFCSDEGRIFIICAGGFLYEMSYQAKNGWFTRKCSLQQLSISGSLISTFYNTMFSGNPNEIANYAIDNERKLIYLLRDDNSIEMFDISTDFKLIARNTALNKHLNALNKYYFQLENKKNEKLSKKQKKQTSNSNEKKYLSRKLVSLSVAPKSLSFAYNETIQMIAVTNLGDRFFFNITSNNNNNNNNNKNNENTNSNNNIQINKLELILIKPTFQEFRLIDLNKIENQNLTAFKAFTCGPDLFTFTLSKNKQSNTVLVTSMPKITENDYSNLFDEEFCKLTIKGKIFAFEELYQNPDQYQFNDLKKYNEQSLIRNERVSQYHTSYRTFLCLTNRGLHTMNKFRPIDIIQKSIINSMGKINDLQIKKCISDFGFEETLSLCLHLFNSIEDTEQAQLFARVFFLFPKNKFHLIHNIRKRSLSLFRWFARFITIYWNKPIFQIESEIKLKKKNPLLNLYLINNLFNKKNEDENGGKKHDDNDDDDQIENENNEENENEFILKNCQLFISFIELNKIINIFQIMKDLLKNNSMYFSLENSWKDQENSTQDDEEIISSSYSSSISYSEDEEGGEDDESEERVVDDDGDDDGDGDGELDDDSDGDSDQQVNKNNKKSKDKSENKNEIKNILKKKQSNTEPEIEIEIEPESESESESETNIESKKKQKSSQSKSKLKNKSKLNNKNKSKSELGMEREKIIEFESKLETETESESELETESELEPELELKQRSGSNNDISSDLEEDLSSEEEEFEEAYLCFFDFFNRIFDFFHLIKIIYEILHNNQSKNKNKNNNNNNKLLKKILIPIFKRYQNLGELKLKDYCCTNLGIEITQELILEILEIEKKNYKTVCKSLRNNCSTFFSETEKDHFEAFLLLESARNRKDFERVYDLFVSILDQIDFEKVCEKFIKNGYPDLAINLIIENLKEIEKEEKKFLRFNDNDILNNNNNNNQKMVMYHLISQYFPNNFLPTVMNNNNGNVKNNKIKSNVDDDEDNDDNDDDDEDNDDLNAYQNGDGELTDYQRETLDKIVDLYNVELNEKLIGWLKSVNQLKLLIYLESINIEKFLVEFAHEYLWKLYKYRENYDLAALSLSRLAEQNLSNLPIKLRIKHMEKAILFLNQIESSNQNENVNNHHQQLLKDLCLKLPILRVQQQVLTTIEGSKSKMDEIKTNNKKLLYKLKYQILSLKELYESYVFEYEIWDACLGVLDLLQTDRNDLIQSIWKNIIQEEVNNDQTDNQQLKNRIVRLGKRFYPKILFPVEKIINFLEYTNAILYQEPQFVPNLMAEIGVPFDQIFKVYNKIHQVNSDKKCLLIKIIVHLISIWINHIEHFEDHDQLQKLFILSPDEKLSYFENDLPPLDKEQRNELVNIINIQQNRLKLLFEKQIKQNN